MISAEETVRRIRLYFEGGALRPLTAEQWRKCEAAVTSFRG
ncbi:MAG: hypothetical protein ABIP20_12235 [Chthoniobacteraceae bacterium]